MGLKYRKKVGPITVAKGEVDINPIINFLLFGLPKRKARRELEEGGFEVTDTDRDEE